MIPGRLFGGGRAPILASRSQTKSIYGAEKNGGPGELETTSGRLTAQPIVAVGCLHFSAGLLWRFNEQRAKSGCSSGRMDERIYYCVYCV